MRSPRGFRSEVSIAAPEKILKRETCS